ncbi:MAG TPA: glycoside hydrolase family 66 protein [Symbiobacteriaceae bacterium]|jgi:dextranase
MRRPAIAAAIALAAAAAVAAAGYAWLPVAAVTDIYPQEGIVQPGQAAHLVVQVRRPWFDPRSVTVKITAGLSDQPVAELRTRGGTVAWTPSAAGGYGVTATLGASRVSTAVDAGANWTEKPRYGFLSDFGPANQGQAARFDAMARFHLNGLQFYDWMYRHSDYLPPADEYVDPLKRLLSRPVLLEKIDQAHRHGMAAMAYTAVYAAPKDFYEAHKDWALYDASGNALKFGDDFLFIMNPEAGSPWAQHMLSEYRKIVTQLPFDGIHLDQYGDPHFGFRFPGGESANVDVATALADLIDATAGTIGPRPVFFNDVGGWPMADTAPTRKETVYVEVWPPNVYFDHLRQLIQKGRRLSDGKPVILAAYISPEFEPSVLLTDAVIFASGGYHLEIGEGNGMLADPYFPKYKPMSAALQQHLRRYYDIIVRYQDLLYGKNVADWTPDVEIPGSRVLTGGYGPGIWPVGRQNGQYFTLSLINTTGLKDAKWNSPRLTPPTGLNRQQVSVAMAAPPRALYRIDPDGTEQSPVPVPFTYGQGQVTFTLDHLDYWSVMVFEK